VEQRRPSAMESASGTKLAIKTRPCTKRIIKIKKRKLAAALCFATEGRLSAEYSTLSAECGPPEGRESTRASSHKHAAIFESCLAPDFENHYVHNLYNYAPSKTYKDTSRRICGSGYTNNIPKGLGTEVFCGRTQINLGSRCGAYL
jgi:hypothetical protein